VFKKRIYDIAGLDIGYTLNIFGIIKIKHVKVSKNYGSREICYVHYDFWNGVRKGSTIMADTKRQVEITLA
jgi:hypothetical protein